MDDTRDIAIRADESTKAAHKRLDGINGQIKRLGDSHEGLRSDVDRQMRQLDVTVDVALNDPETGLRAEIASVKADTRINSLKLAALVAVVATVFTTTTSIVVSRLLHSPTSPTIEQAQIAPHQP